MTPRRRPGGGARARRAALALSALLATGALWWIGPAAGGQGVPEAAPDAVRYTISLPAPEHRWLQVEATFPHLGAAPLSVRMSSASPGRYARHDFAKNLFGITARDGGGDPLATERADMARWEIDGHDGTVTFGYRVFGDRVDGTYLAVDETHAHINMPATLVWAAGLEDRPATVRFEAPDGRNWRVATQLYPTDDPLEFTAPNRAYLLDSPAEFSAFADRAFTVPDPADPAHRPTFRVALHHEGRDGDLERYADDVERIVREAVAVYGAFPPFETGRYTFIVDYLQWAGNDAMEHRNSTVVTAPAAIRNQGRLLLGSVSHEFFHVWNVERIRPRSLEPFDFERVNPSGELWLAEGFTNYYGALVLSRAGLAGLGETLARFGAAVDAVRLGPGRRFRSVVEMSRLAPYVDAATAGDRTNWGNLYISYYTWGETLGLGLDLLLRARSADETGRPALTLDDYMRRLWREFGQPGGETPGRVARPYTLADARDALAALTDVAFADDYFDRYVLGREVIDYAPLLDRAGIAVVPRSRQAWLGAPSLRFERGGARILDPVAFGSPLYDAGVERDDVLVEIEGRAVASAERLRDALGAVVPGRSVPLRYARRGEIRETRVTPVPDPGLALVPFEEMGRALTPERERFRAAWLDSRVAF